MRKACCRIEARPAAAPTRRWRIRSAAGRTAGRTAGRLRRPRRPLLIPLIPLLLRLLLLLLLLLLAVAAATTPAGTAGSGRGSVSPVPLLLCRGVGVPADIGESEPVDDEGSLVGAVRVEATVTQTARLSMVIVHAAAPAPYRCGGRRGGPQAESCASRGG